MARKLLRSCIALALAIAVAVLPACSDDVADDTATVVHVYSPVTGNVARVYAPAGSRVDAGDLLATIESPDIVAASANVDAAVAALRVAEVDLARQRELHRLEASSQRDVEAADNAYRSAKAELERARALAALVPRGETFALRAPVAGEVLVANAAVGMAVEGQYSGANPIELFAIGERAVTEPPIGKALALVAILAFLVVLRALRRRVDVESL
jgi:cobalt-zinc-cadmium efflux system membrane fusion protein